jgi:hypothetical protein
MRVAIDTKGTSPLDPGNFIALVVRRWKCHPWLASRRKMEVNMAAPVIRISLGTFDAEKATIIEAKLIESKAALEAGIRAMRGNLGYYVGIDRRNSAISNVSLWDTVEAAEQMATFQPMIDLAGAFVALGVRFQRPILNLATLWELH